ncbi:MAG: hypothetical protein U0V74_00595 [Chitinophagales bacterium]
MRKTDKLFDFIQAMTAHERGYFKQNSNKNSYYVILFDAICRQHEYNERELGRILKKHGCARKISSIKEYLWRELTQAMAPYHLIKTPIGEAIAQMQRLHLMSSKGLTKHIHRELEALKKFCLRYELFDTLLHALHFEFRFGFHQLSLNDNYWAQFHDAVYSNMIHMQLSEIQHQIYLKVMHQPALNNSAYHRRQIEGLIQHSALSDPIVETSVRLKIIKEGILDLYAHLLKDYEAIVRHNMNVIELLEKKPHLIKDGREISLICANIATALANAGQRNQIVAVIDEVISRFDRIEDYTADTHGHALEVHVLKMLALHNFNDLQGLLDQFHDRSHRIPAGIKQKLYYYFTIALIKQGLTDDALDCINEAFAFYRKHKMLGPVYSDRMKLLHLFLHYQLRNFVYVGNQVESFIRTYKPESKDGDFQLVIARHLLMAVKAADGAPTLKKLRAVLLNDYKHTINSIFIDYTLWIDCILTNSDYAVSSQQQAKAELVKIKAGLS